MSNWYDEFIPYADITMATAVKKTISLPRDLAQAVEQMARDDGKTLSAVVQDPLRAARATRLRDDLAALPGCWNRRAKERGILTEEDLARYLPT